MADSSPRSCGGRASKGAGLGSAALAKVARERAHGLPRLELIIRGAKPGSGDDLANSLRSEVGAADLNVIVRTFTTRGERLDADMRRASLVIMPSRTEGFGLVGLEAIAAGTPLLVSGESGLGQLLKEVLEQEQAAARIVVDMRGETQRVQDRWAGHISRMLADRDFLVSACDAGSGFVSLFQEVAKIGREPLIGAWC